MYRLTVEKISVYCALSPLNIFAHHLHALCLYTLLSLTASLLCRSGAGTWHTACCKELVSMWIPQCWRGLTTQLFSDAECFLGLLGQGKRETFLATSRFTHLPQRFLLWNADLCWLSLTLWWWKFWEHFFSYFFASNSLMWSSRIRKWRFYLLFLFLINVFGHSFKCHCNFYYTYLLNK